MTISESSVVFRTRPYFPIGCVLTFAHYGSCQQCTVQPSRGALLRGRGPVLVGDGCRAPPQAQAVMRCPTTTLRQIDFCQLKLVFWARPPLYQRRLCANGSKRLGWIEQNGIGGSHHLQATSLPRKAPQMCMKLSRMHGTQLLAAGGMDNETDRRSSNRDKKRAQSKG
jgi:hypothetical protein